MFEQFQGDKDSTSYELDQQIETTETKMQHASDVDCTEFREIWEECKMLHANVKKSFTERK